VGVPSPQFGLQEIAKENEIVNCLKYVRPGNGYEGPNFPLTKKTNVNGIDADPLYVWLKAKAPENPGEIKANMWLDNTTAMGLHVVPVVGSDVAWNFVKFLVGRDGKTVKRFGNKRLPFDEELVAAIETALKN